MKSITIFFILSFFCFCKNDSFAFDEIREKPIRSPLVDSLKRAQIKISNIRSSIESRYNIYETDSSRITLVTTTQYDRNGDAIVVVTRDFWRSKYDSIIFSFDSFGNILRALEYDSLGSVVKHDTHTFNDRGNPVESKYYDKKSDLWYRITYSYNPAGQIVQKTDWDRDCDLCGETETFAYDSIGNRIRHCDRVGIGETTYDNEKRMVFNRTIIGNDTSNWVFQYIKDGLKETKIRNLNGKLYSILTNTYDKTGKIVEEKTEAFPESRIFNIRILSYLYDDSGKTLIDKYFNSHNVLKARQVQRLDLKNNIVESVSYDSSGNVYNHEKKQFDQNGNILRYEEFGQKDSMSGQKEKYHSLIKWEYQYFKN